MANTSGRDAPQTRDVAHHPVERRDRAQPPIRWPHPDRSSLVLVGVWVIGLLVALLLPASIVGPGETNPPVGEVWTAFGCTLLGAAVMLGAAGVLWRRSGDSSVLVLGGVPAVATVAGGVILTATKIFN